MNNKALVALYISALRGSPLAPGRLIKAGIFVGYVVP
jgi:hypothetical protein